MKRLGCFIFLTVSLIPVANAQKPAFPVKKLTSCERLQRGATRYVLQNDVQSAGTCFSIEADNVVLDLNGHTVTYATAEKSIPTFGVLAADCWFKPIAGNPCGGVHRSPTVMNGSITQGDAAAPFSHALRFGQGQALTGIKVHNLTIRIHAEDSIAIYSEYLPGGSDVYGNTIYNNVRTISSRTQFRGASIKLDAEDKARLADKIHDNVIRGGAQIGIRSDNPAGTEISRNDISQDAVYTNGFCIDAAGRGLLITGNYCHPVHGRGIHANESDIRIENNKIVTVDSDKNAEYHGCEIHGTYGIQLEDDGSHPTSFTVVHNKVTVYARKCAAEALRLTSLRNAALQIHDNVFAAVQQPAPGDAAQPARAVSIGDADGAGASITANTMRGDSAIFHVDWDGGNAWTLAQNAFGAASPGKQPMLAEFENGARPSHDIRFADNSMGGVNPASARFAQESGDSAYMVLQTLHVHSGRPAAGLDGTVIAEGRSIVAAEHNGTQDLSFLLPVLRAQHEKPVARYAPYTLTVRASGCAEYRATLKSVGSQPMNVSLNCR